MPEPDEQLFAAHSAWIAGLRATYDASCRRPVDDVQQPSASTEVASQTRHFGPPEDVSILSTKQGY